MDSQKVIGDLALWLSSDPLSLVAYRDKAGVSALEFLAIDSVLRPEECEKRSQVMRGLVDHGAQVFTSEIAWERKPSVFELCFRNKLPFAFYILCRKRAQIQEVGALVTVKQGKKVLDRFLLC